MSLVPLIVWVERRGSAFYPGSGGSQPRHDPRLERLRSFSPVGGRDFKFFTKETFYPAQANWFYYLIAPGIVVVTSVMAFAVIPIADDVNVMGHVIPLSIARIEGGVVGTCSPWPAWAFWGIIIGGWASGSKYPLLGAVRTASQMLSYEVSLGLSVTAVLLVYGTLDLNQIVQLQGHLIMGIIPAWGGPLLPDRIRTLLDRRIRRMQPDPFRLAGRRIPNWLLDITPNTPG